MKEVDESIIIVIVLIIFLILLFHILSKNKPLDQLEGKILNSQMEIEYSKLVVSQKQLDSLPQPMTINEKKESIRKYLLGVTNGKRRDIREEHVSEVVPLVD